MTMRVCAEPGCPVLGDKARCAEHRREREQARGNAAARGYGAEYRRQLRAPAYVNATRCTECGTAFTEHNPKTGGHTIPLREGGQGSRVVAQCRRCNYGWVRTGL